MESTTIDLKISSAYQQSEALCKRKPRWQDDVDNLLDRMNDLNKMLVSLHRVLLQLTFEIERDMEGFKRSETAPVIIKKLVALSTRAMNLVRQSDLFPGVKTTYRILKQEINYLNELLHDRSVSIALDEDEVMEEIVRSTISAVKAK
ncbi:MAG: hypothetical protein U0T84_03210 [Chitinophagales bacterium]